MNMKFEIGKIEAAVILIGTVLFWGLAQVQNAFVQQGFILFKTYIYMPNVMLALIAALFGPICATVIGLCGQILADLFIAGSIQYVGVFGVTLFGLVMGLYSCKYNVMNRPFDYNVAIDFNIIQFMSMFVMWVLFHTIVSFLLLGADFNYELIRGMKGFVGTFLSIMVIDTFILKLVGLMVKARRKQQIQ